MTLERITLEAAQRFGDDEVPEPCEDCTDLELAVIALKPSDYFPDLPTVEIPITPEEHSGRRGEWPGDRYLAMDGDRLVEVVRVPDGPWERAAENGMGA